MGGILVLVALGVFCVAVYRTAWLCDDAYISYRVADNVVHGHGPVWNTTERVQAFTNPLWTFLHAAVFAVTREHYLTPLAISGGVSLLAVGVAAFGVASAPAAAVFGVVALTFSRAFVDYSTSGLENPLTHLLLALFVWALLPRQLGAGRLLLLSFIAGLGVLNRMDSLLLFLPGLAYVWLGLRTWRATGAVLLGFSPFIAWEVFSVIYYGFPFPNTAYSKLGTGIPAMEMFAQGFRYVADSVNFDPLTPVLLVLGLVFVPVFVREGKLVALALGGVLYVLYVMRVGGDFMQGRFLTTPLFLAVLVLLASRAAGGYARWGAMAVVCVLIALRAPHVSIMTDEDFVRKPGVRFMNEVKVGDERLYYARHTGLVHWQPGKAMPDHEWARVGAGYRAADQWMVKVHGAVGFRGLTAGPKVHILDRYALGDPLLARIPAYWTPEWRVGHFSRHVPAWYVAHIEGRMRELQQGAPVMLVEGDDSDVEGVEAAPELGDLLVGAGGRKSADADADLRAYNEKLELITRGPLWSGARWRTIVAMNLGLYDGLIDGDLYRFPSTRRRPLSDFGVEKKAGSAWNAPGSLTLRRSGVQVELGAVRHTARINVGLDNNDLYYLLFMRGGEEVGQVVVDPPSLPGGGMSPVMVSVPNSAIRAGYDSVRVMPRGGDDRYSLAHFLLQ